MIKYMKINGVTLKDSALPQVTLTPEGRAMGAAPGWAVMLDPTYISIPVGFSGDTALNRASGRMISATKDSTSPEIVQENGNPMILAEGNNYLQTLGDVDINPEEWTVFSVIKGIEISGRPRNFIVISEPGNSDSGISLSISYSSQTGQLIVYEYDDDVSGMPQRLPVDAGLIDGSIKLVMVTFSVRDGLRAYVNGELMGHEPNDRRPLTHGYQAGEYRMHRKFRGYYGITGILNADLGKAENTGHRRDIEKFLMAKYGISGAA